MTDDQKARLQSARKSTAQEREAAQAALETHTQFTNPTFWARVAPEAQDEIVSHSVPNTFDGAGWGSSEDAYIEAMIPEIVRSVGLAKANTKAVEVGFATAECLAGVNRRGIDEAHSCGFRGDPNGSLDRTMTVVRFRDTSGAELGMVVH